MLPARQWHSQSMAFWLDTCVRIDVERGLSFSLH